MRAYLGPLDVERQMATWLYTEQMLLLGITPEAIILVRTSLAEQRWLGRCESEMDRSTAVRIAHGSTSRTGLGRRRSEPGASQLTPRVM